MPDVPAWLFDDAAAYDAMRDVAADAAATRASAGDIAAAQQLTGLAFSVEPFIRPQVDEHTASLATHHSAAGESR
ncbi:hypothetical protein [Microbacterium aurum]